MDFAFHEDAAKCLFCGCRLTLKSIIRFLIEMIHEFHFKRMFFLI